MTRRRHATTAAAALLLAGLLAGCSSPRPVLYPDDYYNYVGPAAAEADVEDCMDKAENAGHDDDKAGKVAGSTVVGSGVGAASGAAAGAVFGSAGRGAAVGAVGGATGGFLRGMLRSNKPNPIYRNFVNRCLADRGYQTIGWK